MTKLTVNLGERSYSIVIGAGILGDVQWWSEFAGGQSVAIVTNETIAPLFAAKLKGVLEQSARRVLTVILPDGEQHKNWATLTRVFDALLAARCDRKTLIVALGGGVVGDIAGFAAATYQRGVPFIQVPTTLLAQVDSSVGGKTGINHPSGKNMIGAFYQPRAVLIDLETLDSLAPREFSAGLAEIIKHGAACDRAYFDWLDHNLDALIARDPKVLAEAIAESCRIKARIVNADEHELGLRAVLNFGHTFGHAIETGLGYGSWLHGEAVAAGMCLAAQLSMSQGGFPADEAHQLRRLVDRAGLPTVAPDLGVDRWLELMSRDKKATNGTTRFVLLRRLGEAFVASVPEPLVAKLLASAPLASRTPRAATMPGGRSL